MSKAAAPPIELASADPSIAQEMTRWLSHLGAERRLSPKTLEAYGRDLRQCLDFLSNHWGERVTLSRFAALEATDIRAFMAMRRADDIAGRSLMRALAGLRSFGRFLERAKARARSAPCRRSARPRWPRLCRSRCRWLPQNVSPMPTSAPARNARRGFWPATPR
ncbi:site-specific recombinase XerC [Bradyrhizobium japonicum]|nr:site-specific recombinase XerC [Bradyrhizobium japonicum]